VKPRYNGKIRTAHLQRMSLLWRTRSAKWRMGEMRKQRTRKYKHKNSHSGRYKEGGILRQQCPSE
jgi:hypothetical protein